MNLGSDAGQGLPADRLLSWYGDDFTGSAAVMEVLEFAGIPSVLFLDIPTDDQLQRFSQTRAVGLAGVARSQSVQWMKQYLPEAFSFLASLHAPIAHYKICSTLDSSPEVGSIGAALDVAMPLLAGQWSPLLVAAPPLGRYQAFGHLFARSPEGVIRLDRHPTMSRHPVTPIRESDVRSHLAQQTRQSMGLVDLVALQEEPSTDVAWQSAQDSGQHLIALDAVDEATLRRAGGLVWRQRGDRLLAVGSQGIEYALVAYWREQGWLPPAPAALSAGPVERIVVVSGSVSPDTAAQIAYALDQNFVAIPVDASCVITSEQTTEQAIGGAVAAALQVLANGADPIILTARGPDDPAVARYRSSLTASGMDPATANERVGVLLGRILERVLRASGVRRAVVAGGDTSGHATLQLGIYALTVRAGTVPGASLFAAHSVLPEWMDLELALKGGQMGTANYFSWIKAGGGPAFNKGS